MRVLREQQPSSLVRAQQLWNEWEIQCLVLLSFSLQVLLLFFALMRKRSSSVVLRVLLWLAYLSADYVAIFILGRLTLHGDATRHQLVVFWAPFLLLHLGGPDTITAFSMEDTDLWKRHLLNLVSQVALAGYVVGKQWRNLDKQLHTPMVLMFISGTIKYAERTCALYRVGSKSTPTSISVVSKASASFGTNSPYYHALFDTLPPMEEKDLAQLAIIRFGGILDIFMDVSSYNSGAGEVSVIKEGLEKLQSSADRVYMAYKLAEIHLSLIYDYLYTKFGTRYVVRGEIVGCPMCNAIQRLVCFASTSAALVLFVRRVDITKYNGADVVVSYILLVGAITLEVSAIFLGCISSYWSEPSITGAWHSFWYCCICCFTSIPWVSQCSDYISQWVGGIIRTLIRRLHLLNRGEWSGNLAQYNLIGGGIQEKRAGRWEKMQRRIGIRGDTTVVAASAELKKVVLDKLLGVLTTPRLKEWDLTRFHGQWAQWALGEMQHEGSSMAAEQALEVSCIQDLDFVSNVIIWHYTTDLCFFTHKAAGDNSSEQLRATCMELSNYILHLIAKHKLVGSCDVLYLVGRAQEEVKWCLDSGGGGVDNYRLILQMRGVAPGSGPGNDHYAGLDQAWSVHMELLKIDDAYDRWELITAVWVEMLVYLAHDSGASFHAKHLSMGGEFVTHVRMLLIILGLQCLTDLKKRIPYEPPGEKSNSLAEG